MKRNQAEWELLHLLQQTEQCDRNYAIKEVRQSMAKSSDQENIVYLTGDTHGRFDRIASV